MVGVALVDLSFWDVDIFNVDFLPLFFGILADGSSGNFSIFTGSGLICFRGFFYVSSSFPYFPPQRISYNLVFLISKSIQSSGTVKRLVPAWLCLYIENNRSPAAKVALKLQGFWILSYILCTHFGRSIPCIFSLIMTTSLSRISGTAWANLSIQSASYHFKSANSFNIDFTSTLSISSMSESSEPMVTQSD